MGSIRLDVPPSEITAPSDSHGCFVRSANLEDPCRAVQPHSRTFNLLTFKVSLLSIHATASNTYLYGKCLLPRLLEGANHTTTGYPLCVRSAFSGLTSSTTTPFTFLFLRTLELSIVLKWYPKSTVELVWFNLPRYFLAGPILGPNRAKYMRNLEVYSCHLKRIRKTSLSCGLP